MMSASSVIAQSRTPRLIDGVFWQPDFATVQPQGNWDKLGARTFVVQSMITDDKAWFQSKRAAHWEKQPDWSYIRRQPWAKNIIIGLAGSYSEKKAREHLLDLRQQSLILSHEPLIFKPAGYYFPVEADPSWANVAEMRHALFHLPKPLWVSIYAGERNPQNYALWVKSWLPDGVNVFFQDGVGVGTRTPKEARVMMNDLIKALGPKHKIAVVMEAFRSQPNGTFRPAQATEIEEQLAYYRGLSIYAFDGPHYLHPDVVNELYRWGQKSRYAR